mmetsp:Transcript_20797/g.67359  ORF Transcript_20797/g.67359 Transcript_20797/m.67359 type:complete len:222 (+) Transcript_20797:222-887(+)|eukprot:scaffold9208_cov98-Isochrysis_galbana.AAC.6
MFGVCTARVVARRHVLSAGRHLHGLRGIVEQPRPLLCQHSCVGREFVLDGRAQQRGWGGPWPPAQQHVACGGAARRLVLPSARGRPEGDGGHSEQWEAGGHVSPVGALRLRLRDATLQVPGQVHVQQGGGLLHQHARDQAPPHARRLAALAAAAAGDPRDSAHCGGGVGHGAACGGRGEALADATGQARTRHRAARRHTTAPGAGSKQGWEAGPEAQLHGF